MTSLINLIDGGQAVVDIVGTGPPLFWFEGGPGFPADLGLPDVALLADQFTCYLINPPGVGGSHLASGLPAPDHLGHARFYEQVRQALGLGPVLAMGHSWGGLIALTYAATHPDSVTGCLVIDGFAGDPSLDPDTARAERDRELAYRRDWPLLATALELERSGIDTGDPRHDTDPDGIRWRLYFADPTSPAAIHHAARIKHAEPRMSHDVMDQWWPPGPYADTDIRELLPHITCPTLVTVGAHDMLCGPAWAAPIVAGCPTAELVTFPDSGHTPQYEQPSEFRNAVLSWYHQTIATTTQTET